MCECIFTLHYSSSKRVTVVTVAVVVVTVVVVAVESFCIASSIILVAQVILKHNSQAMPMAIGLIDNQQCIRYAR
jgi:hypothetical protein